jgi:hypothetical protein
MSRVVCGSFLVVAGQPAATAGYMFFGRQPPAIHTPPPMAAKGSEPGQSLLELLVDEPEPVPPVEPPGIADPGGSQPPL